MFTCKNWFVENLNFRPATFHYQFWCHFSLETVHNVFPFSFGSNLKWKASVLETDFLRQRNKLMRWIEQEKTNNSYKFSDFSTSCYPRIYWTLSVDHSKRQWENTMCKHSWKFVWRVHLLFAGIFCYLRKLRKTCSLRRYLSICFC